MRAACFGLVLLLASLPALAERPAGGTVPAGIQGKYGDWMILASRNPATGDRVVQLVSPALGAAIGVPFSGPHQILLFNTTGGVSRVRVDRNPAVDLRDTASAREVLRQMLTGKKVAFEFSPSSGRRPAEASLEGFADAWKAASAAGVGAVVQAYVNEPCDSDYHCMATTLCEDAATPYCSDLTSTCQCPEGSGGGGTGGGGNNGGGSCNNPPPCGQGQTWNADRCACCGPCQPPEELDPYNCTCGCPLNPGCPLPRQWNGATCTCVCVNQPIAGCPARTAWNHETCECEAF